jgi:hypothetical protein
MLRILLILLLAIVVARALRQVLAGVFEGMAGRRPGRTVPSHGVHMIRDPVCGTFVVPARAVTLVEGRERLYFCSDRCRDTYRARTA